MTKPLRTEYVVINSGDRRREAMHRFGKMIILPENAVIIRTSPSGTSTILHIDYSPELAEVSIGDSIVLDNLVGKSTLLTEPFSARKSSLYLRVTHPDHGQREGLDAETRFERIASTSRLGLEEFITVNPSSQVKVEITAPGGLNALGITPRWLQASRRAFLIYNKVDGRYQLDPNSYLLRLDQPAPIDYSDSRAPGRESNPKISVRFNSFYGLAMDASSRDRASPSPKSIGLDNPLTVTAVRDDSFIVEMMVVAGIVGIVQVKTQMILKKIIEIETSYPSANVWIASLPRRFDRVEKVRVISSIFPNSQRVIDSHNNEIIWQMDQGNYRARIPPGNYSPDELTSQLARAMKDANPAANFKVTIDPATSQVTFVATKRSKEFNVEAVPERVDPGGATYRLERVKNSWRLYREGRLEMHQSVLINWGGQIVVSANAPLLETFSYNHHLMLLQWPGERLRVDDLIITDQFYDPSSETQQYIYRVLDGSRSDGLIQLEPDEQISLIYDGRKYVSNQMPIDLPTIVAINPALVSPYFDLFVDPDVIADLAGMNDLSLIYDFGYSSIARVVRSERSYLRIESNIPAAKIQEIELPLRMRLVMSENSILKSLGFETSTDYHYLISQTAPALQLSGENCLYLLSDTLSTIPISGNLRNIFQIINWHHPPGTVCYDAHTPLIKSFTPATELTSIDLKAVNPDGSPYQFNGLDYQLVLEIQHR